MASTFAAVYNSVVGELGNDYDLDDNDDADIDGDGLFDWTRGMRLIQPGTSDFDGDGILDGDIADQADTAIGMGKPAGYTLVQDAKSGDWGWEIDLDAPAVATGARSFTSVFLPPDPVRAISSIRDSSSTSPDLLMTAQSILQAATQTRSYQPP